MFWRKLDISPCMSLEEDDLGCDLELQMFNTQFKKQSRAGKFSILKKLREIIAPSTTLACEPKIQTTTRGRPSFKSKIFRNSCKDPTVPIQEPRRQSCSSASKFSDRDDSQFVDKARHSFYADRKYPSHPYINQFPTILHPYITQVQDVRSDGNCGFRAIATCLGLSEDAWPTIRGNLIEELETYKLEYVDMFGVEGWFDVYNTLNFFESDRCAPLENWMTMPNMGVLIASKYDVILHVISNRGSMTYLPLRSAPPPWYQHVTIAIGHVNDNHYVKVSLSGGYPMPRITQQWVHFKYDCAAAWATLYLNRINKYEEYLRSHCTTDSVILE